MTVKISSPAALFPASFAEGRSRFREAAAAAGAVLGRFDNPAKGPNGEALSTDTAWLGPKDARRLFFAQAGTHGAEGFCGSAIETGWLQSGIFTQLPADTAVLLVHAINPYGFAWVRLACVTANVLTFLTMQRAAAAGTSDLLRSEAPTAWRSPGPPGAVKLAETAAVGWGAEESATVSFPVGRESDSMC